MARERELLDPLEQHRDAVGLGGRHEERVKARLERLLAQQPRAERAGGMYLKLLVSAAQRVLQAGAQLVGGGRRLGEHEHGFGSHALLDQPGETGHERMRLAGSRASQDQQRPRRMRDRGALRR